MDPQLKTLIDLQAVDARIAALEADAARIPREIAALHAAVGEARTQVEQTKARLDSARKELRALEKDLEIIQGRRVKCEARLYEVKTNKEYSAVLVEIEDIKQEKARDRGPDPQPHGVPRAALRGHQGRRGAVQGPRGPGYGRGGRAPGEAAGRRG